jgi:ribosomal subunit interface protein
MQLLVKGRPKHTVTSELHEYATAKFGRLSRFLPDESTVEVVLIDERGPKAGVDKSIHVTITRPGEKEPLHIEEISPDFRASIDVAQDRAERLVRKIKERSQALHRRMLHRSQAIVTTTARQTAAIPGWIWKTIRRQLERRGERGG